MAKVGFTLNGQDFEFETDGDTAARLAKAGGFSGLTGKNLWHVSRLSIDYGPLPILCSGDGRKLSWRLEECDSHDQGAFQVQPAGEIDGERLPVVWVKQVA
jgi:hypothetical protein